MYIIAFVGIAITLFLGADDKVGDLEKTITSLQEKLNELLPDLNEMNEAVESQEKKTADRHHRYDVLDRQLESLKIDDPKRDSIRFLKEQARVDWHQAKDELEPMQSIRDSLQEKVDKLTLEIELKQKSLERLLEIQKPSEPKKFVGVTLSQTCERLILVNATHDCPTYSQLIQAFDNTNPLVSGQFYEKNNDLRRADTPMKNHWEFYDHKKYGTVVMVDPDNDYKKRAVIVEIQPNDFQVVNIWGGQSKQSGFVNGTIISYTGLYVDSDCRRILSAPDMERITNTINFATSGCSETFEINPNIITLNQTAVDKSIHKEYQYQEWLEKVIEDFRGWMVGK